MDRIYIRDLRCQCVLGVYEDERHRQREVILNLVIYHNPVQSDDIRQAVDYDALSQQIVSHVQSTQFQLIESLANSIAGVILQDPKVLACRVTVDKPGVPAGARSAVGEVFRTKNVPEQIPQQQ